MQLLRAGITVSVLVVCGCAADGGSAVKRTHDGMDATLWLQASAEYAASTRTIYAAAAAQLERIAAANPGDVDRMAVVMDVDETVLDNSRYQGQMVLDDTSYESASWDRWIALRDASAVPGSVDFIRTSQALGVEVLFVTNRACRDRIESSEHCPQKLDTLVNLRNLGVDTEAEALYLRNDVAPIHCRGLLAESERTDGSWSSDKTSRRACIAAGHDIVMLFGDQLGDFTENADSVATQHGGEMASTHARFWGRTWFMLPNPTYGDWQPRTSADKRAVIRGID